MSEFKVGCLYRLTEDLDAFVNCFHLDKNATIVDQKLVSGSLVLIVDLYSFYQDYVCVELLYKDLIYCKSISRNSLNKILKEIE